MVGVCKMQSLDCYSQGYHLRKYFPVALMFILHKPAKTIVFRCSSICRHSLYKPQVLLALYHTVQQYCIQESQRLGFCCPKSSLQTKLNIYFVTSRQYRLGIAKLKNVFRLFLTHSKKLLQNFKNFLFTRIFY